MIVSYSQNFTCPKSEQEEKKEDSARWYPTIYYNDKT